MDHLTVWEDNKCKEEKENNCQEVGRDKWPANHLVLTSGEDLEESVLACTMFICGGEKSKPMVNSYMEEMTK